MYTAAINSRPRRSHDWAPHVAAVTCAVGYKWALQQTAGPVSGGVSGCCGAGKKSNRSGFRVSALASGGPLPHLLQDWARPCHICSKTGLALATSAPGLSSPLPHLCRDWARPCHICSETELTPATSAPPGTGLAPAKSALGLGLGPYHICMGTGLTPPTSRLTPATSAPRLRTQAHGMSRAIERAYGGRLHVCMHAHMRGARAGTHGRGHGCRRFQQAQTVQSRRHTASVAVVCCRCMLHLCVAVAVVCCRCMLPLYVAVVCCI